MIARLRAEHDASDSAPTKAILLHEIGVLEELMGDEASAARDQLNAVNVEPDFREPLERLIAIIDRRQSYKNLGKLLERLVRVADGPEERVRALIERAAFLSDHEQDRDGARELLEEAVQDRPDDATAWLALEIVAAKLNDDALRSKALGARAELTQHPTWRALLLLDLASTQEALGDVDAAFGALDHAIAQKSECTFSALAALEDLARREEREEVLARALEAQATLVLRSLEDSSAGDALGVPHYRRTAAHAADAWLRASDAQRRRGDLEAATELLDQALERLPDENALLHARMNVAVAAGDIQTSADLARRDLERGVKGPLAAACQLRIAEAAAAGGDAASALAAVDRALAEDPASIPARALQLDLLIGGADPSALASALEATAEQLESDDAKTRCYLLAADAWARVAGDGQGARAALSQAGMFGAAPSSLARAGRLLAAVTDDANWYEETTRRLLAAGASDAEQPSLWFELARLRLLRGEPALAAQALGSLAQTAGGAWLGHVLLAFALPVAKPRPPAGGPKSSMPPPPPDASAALEDLAATEPDPNAQRALRLLVARRAYLADDAENAIKTLWELHADDVADDVVATNLASLLAQTGDAARAADVLTACAAACEDGALGASLELEAGLLRWRNNDRKGAIEAFSAASRGSAEASQAMLGWALRAADPENVEARRRALEATAGGAASELERFALEAGVDGDAGEATAALEAMGQEAGGDLRHTALLARALWARSDVVDPDTRRDALAEFAKLGDSAAAIASASSFQMELTLHAEQPDSQRLAEAAARWTEVDPRAPAAVEWLAAECARGDFHGEVAARRALADRLGGTARTELTASAALVSALDGNDLEPLLTDTHPAAQLTNLELSLPGSDPRRRAMALTNVDGALGEESESLLAALAGWNLLAGGDAEAAATAFRAVVEAHPDELIGWDGLRTAAQAMGDRVTVAEASAALGDAVSDASRGAELWEQAALILIDELNDPERGEFALSRAVERDIGRFVAFDKLFRIVRARKDQRRLLDLITLRLEVAEDPDEIAKLFWERARVLRAEGDREGALAALENVTMLEPDHVGALALSGEVYITTGRFAEAAKNLSRLATLDEAPVKQRLMSGVAAVDIFENKLGEPQRALEVLQDIYRGGLSTLPVRERLAKTAANVGAWDQATEVLEQLMRERESAEGRVEAARLCMAIFRDRLGQPARAADAVSALLAENPGDGEALDLALSGALPADLTRALLEQGQNSLVNQLTREPLDAERVDRLARVAARLGKPALRQAALGSLIALGEGSAEIDHELNVLDQRVARLPAIAIDEAALPDLCDPEDRGPVPVLMRALATTLAEALGPGLGAFGVGKKDRVDPRHGLPLRNEVAAWAGALGIGDFDLYVGGQDSFAVYAVATEKPAIVVGDRVSAPLAPPFRQAVARELFALRRGTTILRHRDVADIAALVVAACSVVGVQMSAPHYAMLAEFQRQLGKEMSRKTKKLLPELAQAVAMSGQDPIAWAQAATSSLDRLAAVAAGDVSHVLAQASGARGQMGASIEAKQRAARLLSFVLSPAYLRVRELLGMGVR